MNIHKTQKDKKVISGLHVLIISYSHLSFTAEQVNFGVFSREGARESLQNSLSLWQALRATSLLKKSLVSFYQG